MSSGYSGTPLAKKLGLKTGYRFVVYNQPEYYFELFPDLPDDINPLPDFSPFSADFIHIFCHNLEDLTSSYNSHKKALKRMVRFGSAGQRKVLESKQTLTAIL